MTRPTLSSARSRGLGRPAFRAALAAALLVAASALPVTAAGPTSLVNADVSPTTATTTTTITFAVTYRNTHGAPPDYVRVRIGGAMHDMHPTTGSQDWKSGGRFAFTTKLKAGTYDVTFFGSDEKRHEARLSGGTVSVKPAPTPKPTPKPRRSRPPGLRRSRLRSRRRNPRRRRGRPRSHARSPSRTPRPQARQPGRPTSPGAAGIQRDGLAVPSKSPDDSFYGSCPARQAGRGRVARTGRRPGRPRRRWPREPASAVRVARPSLAAGLGGSSSLFGTIAKVLPLTVVHHGRRHHGDGVPRVRQAAQGPTPAGAR